MTRREKIAFLCVYAAAIPVALALSYGFARLGHPSALWLWRDMLGFI